MTPKYFESQLRDSSTLSQSKILDQIATVGKNLILEMNGMGLEYEVRFFDKSTVFYFNEVSIFDLDGCLGEIRVSFFRKFINQKTIRQKQMSAKPTANLWKFSGRVIKFLVKRLEEVKKGLEKEAQEDKLLSEVSNQLLQLKKDFPTLPGHLTQNWDQIELKVTLTPDQMRDFLQKFTS